MYTIMKMRLDKKLFLIGQPFWRMQVLKCIQEAGL